MDEKYVCLTCGKTRSKPKKDVSKDFYGRPMLFCNDYCATTYFKRQPKA